jgi:hypothetical protein
MLSLFFFSVFFGGRGEGEEFVSNSIGGVVRLLKS